MGRLRRQRLWTSLSFLPLLALCGVLLYGYVIRPRLERAGWYRAARMARPGPPQPTWSPFKSAQGQADWTRNWQAIRPRMLAFLGEERRKVLETGKERGYEFDFAALPEDVRNAIQEGIGSHPATAGKRILSGRMEYFVLPAREGAARNIHVQGIYRLEGTTTTYGFGWKAG